MWTLVLSDIDTKQTLLYLPLDTARAVPSAYQAEFNQQPKLDIIELTFVDPNTPARAKRYKVVRHNGSIWTSVPRPWLRDRSARNGDSLMVTQASPLLYAISGKDAEFASLTTVPSHG
jgi:hypothetical protein